MSSFCMPAQPEQINLSDSIRLFHDLGATSNLQFVEYLADPMERALTLPVTVPMVAPVPTPGYSILGALGARSSVGRAFDF